MTERFLTVTEVAYVTREPEYSIRRWIRERVLPVERVGPTKRVRVRLSVLRAMYPPDALRTLPEPATDDSDGARFSARVRTLTTPVAQSA